MVKSTIIISHFNSSSLLEKLLVTIPLSRNIQTIVDDKSTANPIASRLLVKGKVNLIFWCFLVKNLCGAGFIEYHKEILTPMLIALSIGFAGNFFIYNIDSITLRLLFGSVIGFIMILTLNLLFNKEFIIDISQTFFKGIRK